MVSTVKKVQVSPSKHRAKSDGQGTVDEKNKTPRLPHEIDESSDSQQSPPRTIIKQAFDDIEAGQVDTDRTGMPGVEEVHRKNPDKTTPEAIPESSRMPPSIPKE
ncbi:hypothetical protein [Herminiimonas sp.]|uniref:hypothetical protein n=1 Tax=Herminiimonas sp. TaxID=1926289 RepID=UPI00271B499F|nr:hypothetical protein [Herminiimonas sp.]MDO8304593.1 hypothetical protein [Herminiimonas sp.]